MSLLVQINPPPYDRARAAFAYKGSAAALVKRLKFGDRPDLAPFLARFMLAAEDGVLSKDAVLLPVPLHRRRLFCAASTKRRNCVAPCTK